MNGVHDMGGMHGFGPVQPKENEPVFHSPWEAQAFGMALALESQATYQWEDFRSRLIQQIAQDGQQDAEPEYYQQWFAALEDLAVSFRFVTEEELDRRTQEIAYSEEQ